MGSGRPEKAVVSASSAATPAVNQFEDELQALNSPELADAMRAVVPDTPGPDDDNMEMADQAI